MGPIGGLVFHAAAVKFGSKCIRLTPEISDVGVSTLSVPGAVNASRILSGGPWAVEIPCPAPNGVVMVSLMTFSVCKSSNMPEIHT